MSKDPATRDELATALEQLSQQAEHLAEMGRDVFCSSSMEGQIARLAACQIVIQLQAVVEDLPSGVMTRLEHLPLREVRGMRNRLAHGYGTIDPAMLWATIADALPEFVVMVREELLAD